MLVNREQHFAFGENWLNFSKKINEATIRSAEKEFNKLIWPDVIKGKRFLDIGCGSGLHSLIALIQGAGEVFAVDIDPVCVQTTRQVLSEQYDKNNWRSEEISVFDLTEEQFGTFDIVYSWGVLHHTGDMHQAISKSLNMVSPGGLCVLGLYSKTLMCGFWKQVKKYYSKSNKSRQDIIRNIYITLYRISALIAKRKTFKEILGDYHQNRGMDFFNDVHDWLGGYPYESIRPDELIKYVNTLGFECIREVIIPSGLGILGSGNNEFVLRRKI